MMRWILLYILCAMICGAIYSHFGAIYSHLWSDLFSCLIFQTGKS